MLKSYFYIYIILIAFAINNFIIKRCFSLIKVLNKLFNTAFVMESIGLYFLRTKICKSYLEILCKESCLSKSYLKSIIIIDNIIKYCSIRFKCNPCSCLICFTYNLKIIADFTSLISLLINLTFTRNLYL